MSTVTIHIVQHVAIVRTLSSVDPVEVGPAVADVVNRDLAAATGLDWSTLAVTVEP